MGTGTTSSHRRTCAALARNASSLDDLVRHATPRLQNSTRSARPWLSRPRLLGTSSPIVREGGESTRKTCLGPQRQQGRSQPAALAPFLRISLACIRLPTIPSRNSLARPPGRLSASRVRRGRRSRSSSTKSPAEHLNAASKRCARSSPVPAGAPSKRCRSRFGREEVLRASSAWRVPSPTRRQVQMTVRPAQSPRRPLRPVSKRTQTAARAVIARRRV